MTDDGFNIGVLYKGERRPYQPPIRRDTQRVADLEAEFTI